MDKNQPDEFVFTLYKLVMAQQGTIEAQRVMIDSVVSALNGLPTFLEVENETLTALEPHVRDGLEVESLAAYETTVPHFNRCLEGFCRVVD